MKYKAEQPLAKLRNRIIEQGTKRADQFTANPKNWRKHPEKQRNTLAKVLSEIGWVTGVIENIQTGNLVDGHERIWQALDQGDEEPVPYTLVDLSPEEESVILAYFDAISRMAETDPDQLRSLLAEVEEWNPDFFDLNALIAEEMGLEAEAGGSGSGAGGDPGAQMHKAEELRQRFGVERGQVWQIGRHLLMCGDAYNEAHRAFLLRGAEPAMANLDPPYGIEIVKRQNSGQEQVGGSKPFGSTSGAARKSGGAFESVQKKKQGKTHHGGTPKTAIIQSNLYPPIEGDDRAFDPSPFLSVAPTVILWGANNFAHLLPPSKCWIVWDKREDITRNTFADCELAWTNLDSPARLFHHLWNGLHKGSQHGENRTHPTEKPVALFEGIGRMFAPEGVWLDLFAGTCAQMVAAQNIGAVCYAMEFEPLYVAVALDRMIGKGLEPILLETLIED